MLYAGVRYSFMYLFNAANFLSQKYKNEEYIVCENYNKIIIIIKRDI